MKNAYKDSAKAEAKKADACKHSRDGYEDSDKAENKKADFLGGNTQHNGEGIMIQLCY